MTPSKPPDASQRPSSRSPIRAVIFDCDGTLVNSEEPGLDVMHEMVREQGIDITRAQADSQFRGVRMANCVAWVAAQLPHKSATFEIDFTRQTRIATEQRLRQQLAPLPGAHALLSRLAATHSEKNDDAAVVFCVATNGPPEKVELTLTLTGLRPLLGDRVYSAYEVGHFKPAPGLFLHAAKELGHAPEFCAVVEDSLPGIEAGLAAGMRVFALLNPTQLPAHMAQQVTCIHHLNELDTHFFPEQAPL